ncbi:unnamed protein product [marine sediment metagenome]|uniref:Uncharacterized protein n=1 Tax=marine sediment metagenome TaxID=412755 RepID=X0VMB4_9ZZZZ
MSSDQITLGSSELKAFATTGYSPGFYPDISFCTLRGGEIDKPRLRKKQTQSNPICQTLLNYNGINDSEMDRLLPSDYVPGNI